MDVSVVIAARNGAETIGAMLESLSQQDFAGTWEVVVADDHSTDDTAAVAAIWMDRVPGLRIVSVEPGTGNPAARNVGTRASAGHLIVYVDCDDTVNPGFVTSMVEASTQAPLLCARLDELNSLGSPELTPADGGLPIAHDFMPFCHGCGLGVTRAVFEEIGGFDEWYGREGAVDIEFSWRVQIAGHPVRFVPDAVVRYRHRTTLRRLFVQRYRWARSEIRLFGVFAAHGLRPRSPWKAVRHWGWLVLHATDLARRDRRARWIATMAVLVGRISGSVQYRVFAP